jgi:TRAP-type uncharacterized transport system substrate-binding protein
VKKVPLITILAAFAAVPAIADVVGLPPLPPVAPYERLMEPGGEFTICTGGIGGAYYRIGAQIAGMMEAYAQTGSSSITIDDASPQPGGGTYGCLTALAEGTVDAAIIQSDGRAILADVGQSLIGAMDVAGAVLTEEIVTICSRDNDTEDFGDIAQTRGALITVAGGQTSGTNVMLNVIASADGGYQRPVYSYEGNFYEAVEEVARGEADCAVGVMDIDTAPVLRQISTEFGDQVRLVGTWDRDFRDLEHRGEQVYGWRAVPEDTPGIRALLDWNGNGRMWSPEVVTVNAMVVYREGMDGYYADILTDAVEAVANLNDDVKN